MSNMETVLEQWAHGVIASLEPVQYLLAREKASEADLKMATNLAHKELAHHSYFGVNLQRLFDLDALQAHLSSLLKGQVQEAPPAAPEATESPKAEAPADPVASTTVDPPAPSEPAPNTPDPGINAPLA